MLADSSLSNKLHRIARLDEWPPEACSGAVSVGNFDGVHLGHQLLVRRLLQSARAVGGPAVVLVFYPHPSAVLRPTLAPTPLTTLEVRASLLLQLGVDQVVGLAPSMEILSLSAESFFRLGLVQAAQSRCIVEGPNFCFGKDRRGDVKLLTRLCEESKVDCQIVQASELLGAMVSSTRIREEILRGEVQEAMPLLARPYFFDGVVVEGAKRGRTLGFPTANLSAIETLLPGQGVYACYVELAGSRYPAAVNIGPNPTFDENARKVEAHLIGFSGDVYGRRMRIIPLVKLRDIQPFPNVQALLDQLREDVKQAQRVCEWSKTGQTDIP